MPTPKAPAAARRPTMVDVALRPLTVIAYDPRELARAAAHLMFRRISGDGSWPATTVLPTQLVERGPR